MSEWKKFKLSLLDHPGIKVVLMMHAAGFISGLSREDASIKMALIASAVMSIFWIPVIWTSWTLRNNYSSPPAKSVDAMQSQQSVKEK